MTGATECLSSAICETLVTSGWTVVSVDTAFLDAYDAQTNRAKVDVTDPRAMRGLPHTIRTNLGPLSLVICAAAIYERNDLDHFDADAHAKVMEVIYGGVGNTISATIPGMVAQNDGRLVIVSSLAGYRRARPDVSGYAASKAALISLADGLHHALADSNVEVRLFAPGFVDTPLMRVAGGPRRLALSPQRAAKKGSESGVGSSLRNAFSVFAVKLGCAVGAVTPGAVPWRIQTLAVA